MATSMMRNTRALAGARAAPRAPSFVARSTSSDVDAPSSSTPSPVAWRNAGPNPERFKVADGWMGEVAAASLSSVLRLGAGALVHGYKVDPMATDDGKYGVLKYSGRKLSETSEVSGFNRPVQALELYEFEACPFCRKVRDAVSILDLDVQIYPCPKDGTVWRPKAIELGGKKQFPYLVDSNTGKSMYESDEIIKYLFNTYGPGEAEIPLVIKAGPVANTSAGLASLARSSKGRTARPSRQPAQPLTLYGYEASPFVKVVKERLSELEIPYLYKSVARGSPKRQELLDKRGHFQVPYLEDPNEMSYLFESSAIVQYLEDTYATKA